MLEVEGLSVSLLAKAWHPSYPEINEEPPAPYLCVTPAPLAPPKYPEPPPPPNSI